MHQKLTPIPLLLKEVVRVLHSKENILWFVISGAVFTLISRALVILPPLLYVAMETTEQTVLFGALIGMSILFSCYVMVFFFALFLLVSRQIALHQSFSLKQMVIEAHRSVGKAIGGIFIFSIVVFGGLLLLIIPGILFGIWFFFAPTIAVLGKERRHLLKQSKALFAGRFWGILLRLAIIYALVMLPTYLLSLINTSLGQIWGITTSFFSFLFTLVYLDAARTQKAG